MSDCLLKINWPDLPSHISVLSTLRTGGASLPPYDDGRGSGGFNLAAHVGDNPNHVQHNRALLAQWLPTAPIWLNQVHGVRVVNLDHLGLTQNCPSGNALPLHSTWCTARRRSAAGAILRKSYHQQDDLLADAAIATQVNVICAVQTADCLPILLCDPRKNIVAAVHAGWRGLARGVLENTLTAIQQAGADLAHCLAWLGPAIGSLQFEVGDEVREQFIDADSNAIAAFHPSEQRADKFYADIYQLARLRLQRAGVHRIAGGEFCTVSQPEKFYSYRRDGVTGRMASLIWVSGISFLDKGII
jgi:YfiH family protein